MDIRVASIIGSLVFFYLKSFNKYLVSAFSKYESQTNRNK